MSGPAISDHAILRFLERGGGLDIDQLRGAISAALARAHGAARSISQGNYTVKVDGIVFVVCEDTVVTVYGEERGTSQKRSRAPR